jgi:hypothetical protein
MASYIDAKGDGTGEANGRRASMLPSFAGLIRTGEIGAGLIPHALAVIAPQRVLTTKAVWPATAFDRGAAYSGTIPMGSLLAIPPSVNVGTLGLSAVGKVIATAAQNYGVYVVDTGGDGLGFLSELGNPELSNDTISAQLLSEELTRIASKLQVASNNSVLSPGGGGTPRTSLAPPLFVP